MTVLDQEMAKARTTVLRTGSLLVEHCCLPSREVHQGHSPESQIVVSYRGAFRWRTGRDSRLIDANAALMVFAGEDFFADHPVPGVGHGNVIITPSPALLDELSRGEDAAAVTRPVAVQTRVRLHRLLDGGAVDRIEAEEHALAIAAAVAGTRGCARAANPRLIERTKQILHASPGERLSLDHLARQVGVTPLYLTRQFTHSTGMPLSRYQRRLRLSRALAELPRCNDLTGLALELGFASHSHFTSAFRAAFGAPPSSFRAAARPRRATTAGS